MTVLGIETSTEMCGVSLVSEDGLLAERSIVEAHIHSEKLLTLVQEVFAEATLTLYAIDAVAVSIGPGSFTGLRIGLSSAKGLCYALEKPIVAVPTFDAIAETVRRSGLKTTRLAIALDAKQGEFYTAAYSSRNGRFMNDGAVTVLALELVREHVHASGAAFIVTDRQQQLQDASDRSEQFGRLVDYCRASSVAQLGLEKLRAKEFANLASVEPMYLKDFVVRTR
ncbi:MAG TPA: tRNA (adenosine(37)-N6)-threonylcarbamoyltransferase complex dimerization subunit type 1 TsaB [Bacteroidota bacterium]